MTIQGISSQGSCAKTLSCVGGHFGFPMNKKNQTKIIKKIMKIVIKNLNILEGRIRNIPVK